MSDSASHGRVQIGSDDALTPTGPLRGVRVVELAGIGPIQHGAMLLADLGADIVRVDRPLAGEAPDTTGEILNRGRRSIALNLKDPTDLDLVWRLLEGADVVLDPYRPGVAERLGLGPEAALERNPRLVFTRMTGWGQSGPLAHAAGHDINYISIAGALGALGEDGEVPPIPLNLIGDYGGGGMMMAFGVVCALLERERSGRGQVVDVAMVDGAASLMGGVFHLMGMGEWTAGRGRNWLQGAAPWYRAYRTSDDAYITVGTLEPQFYRLLLDAVGLEADAWPQWDTQRWPGLAGELAARFARETREHWRDRLEGTDACFAPVLAPEEAIEHPQISARETYVRRDGHVQPAPVPRFDRTPGSIGRRPPRVGEHSAEIRRELGR
jgi:alpha-methylacyl-CoA racemase